MYRKCAVTSTEKCGGSSGGGVDRDCGKMHRELSIGVVPWGPLGGEPSSWIADHAVLIPFVPCGDHGD